MDFSQLTFRLDLMLFFLVINNFVKPSFNFMKFIQKLFFSPKDSIQNQILKYSFSFFDILLIKQFTSRYKLGLKIVKHHLICQTFIMFIELYETFQYLSDWWTCFLQTVWDGIFFYTLNLYIFMECDETWTEAKLQDQEIASLKNTHFLQSTLHFYTGRRKQGRDSGLYTFTILFWRV